MATITLSPIADFSVGLNYQYPEDSGSHYAKILSADDASSYVANKWASGWKYDIYKIPKFALGTINSVSVVIRIMGGTDGCAAIGGFYKNLTEVYAYGSSHSATSWTTFTDTWNTDPFTGAAWTIDSLAKLDVAIGLYNPNASWVCWCTQVYVVIDYIPYGAASETLYPNGAGAYTEIASQEGSGSHYQMVDDSIDSPDEDSTDVNTSSTSYQTDTYALSDLTSGSILHINAVVLFFRARGVLSMGSGAYGKPALYTNSTLVCGTERDDLPVDGYYATFAQVWTTNPVTGVAWTKAEIQALQAGIALKARSGGWAIRCTQVAVVVSYTVDQAPATPPAPSGPLTGAPTVSYDFSSAATDPESDTVQLTFDWGDGNQSTSSFVASGSTATVSHSWSNPGTYTVKVMATDSLGAASGWSSTATIVIASPGSYARVVGLW